MLAQFKSKVTKRIRVYTPGITVWQRNYYEHVVRDEKDLDAIRAYICANPGRWNQDEENQP